MGVESAKRNAKSGILYIRHGHDKRREYKYDEDLTSEGRKKARRKAKELIRLFGVPDAIYCSPFDRTLRTAKEMCRVVHKKTGVALEPQIDPKLGRYFSKSQRKKKQANIKPSTVANGALTTESKPEFRARVEEQLKTLQSQGGLRGTERPLIWNITHSLVLLHVARVQKIKRPVAHVEYLEHIKTL